MTAENLDTFIADVASWVHTIDDEHEITALVAAQGSKHCWPAATGFPRRSRGRRRSATWT